jgi:hypothetical protein
VGSAVDFADPFDVPDGLRHPSRPLRAACRRPSHPCGTPWSRVPPPALGEVLPVLGEVRRPRRCRGAAVAVAVAVVGVPGFFTGGWAAFRGAGATLTARAVLTAARRAGLLPGVAGGLRGGGGLRGRDRRVTAPVSWVEPRGSDASSSGSSTVSGGPCCSCCSGAASRIRGPSLRLRRERRRGVQRSPGMSMAIREKAQNAAMTANAISGRRCSSFTTVPTRSPSVRCRLTLRRHSSGAMTHIPCGWDEMTRPDHPG